MTEQNDEYVAVTRGPDACPCDVHCGFWPLDCPEPMRCAIDHLRSAAQADFDQPVEVTANYLVRGKA